ncbi:cytochrome b [Rhizobium leucaenae]|uniref:Cytochrome b561 n=1 Tax=Rhizobium leucaenae TaxID=29450 RepID=A0A7W6ZZ76_9HYPH|nr:cytochrome b/b6 domain-containing protein [Rhizobium leucaenae]MBB4571464.1 cytochrome b561 [Rhizobium leucaenae]MBB6304325.1 cytochrome b561 [Rhizobium leucaenae]
MASNRTLGYSTTQISLHWIIAALVLFQLLFGESMTRVIRAQARGTAVSSADGSMGTAHYWVGIAVMLLVLLRLALRVAFGAPRPAGASALLVRLAGAAHWLFYALLLLVPLTGLLAYYFSDPFGDIHDLGKPAFIILIGLHAAGALCHQFLLKDGTLRRMLVPAR